MNKVQSTKYKRPIGRSCLGDKMKILVMMKQVANKDAILRINKDEPWIEEGDLSFEVSESDGYALEEALRVREKARRTKSLFARWVRNV